MAAAAMAPAPVDMSLALQLPTIQIPRSAATTMVRGRRPRGSRVGRPAHRWDRVAGSSSRRREKAGVARTAAICQSKAGRGRITALPAALPQSCGAAAGGRMSARRREKAGRARTAVILSVQGAEGGASAAQACSAASAPSRWSTGSASVARSDMVWARWATSKWSFRGRLGPPRQG